MNQNIQSIPLNQAVRLINHGPTVLITAAHQGRRSVMTAAWTVPMDFDPPKLIAIIGEASYTRELLEASGEFAVCVPPKALIKELMSAGASSGRDVADKFAACGLEAFAGRQLSAPLVKGCVGWLECRLIRDEERQKTMDLFVGEVVSAQADARVYKDGGWRFEEAPDELRTLHHAGEGRFYADGELIR